MKEENKALRIICTYMQKINNILLDMGMTDDFKALSSLTLDLNSILNELEALEEYK